MENNTTQIWEKHFGNTPSVGLNHSKIDEFFDELTQDCLNEDVRINQTEIEIEVLVNQHIPQSYFNEGFTVETQWNSDNQILIIAPQFKSLSEKENETMPVFEIDFENDEKRDVVDMYNCNVRSEYFLCSYDKENKEFVCSVSDGEIFSLPISDIEKAFSFHIQEITKNWNSLLRGYFGVKKFNF